MLTFEQIQNTYKLTEPRNDKKRMQLTEYIQCELLDSLFKQEGARFLSFIGGTSIRIVYGGNRFSEDLDFDNFGLSFEGFQDLLSTVASDMKLKGFEIEYRFVEKQAFHCHVKFPKILRLHGLTPLDNEKIMVRIDTLQKNRLRPSETFLLNRFELYRNILVNPASVILSQKLIAALERKTPKGRDFYDISFLYGQTQPDLDFLEKALNVSRVEFAEKLVERCRGLDFKALAEDVKKFLIVPDQIARVETFPEFIRQKSASWGIKA